MSRNNPLCLLKNTSCVDNARLAFHYMRAEEKIWHFSGSHCYCVEAANGGDPLKKKMLIFYLLDERSGDNLRLKPRVSRVQVRTNPFPPRQTERTIMKRSCAKQLAFAE